MTHYRLPLRYIHYVSLFISMLYTSVCATGSSSSSSSTSRVTVSMSNHPSVSMDINSNGDLAYKSMLPSPDITNALIRDNEHATCFFWRSYDASWFASMPFTQRLPLGASFGFADRLYCFDNAVDDDDTFTLLLRYGDDERPKLVRLTIDNNDAYVEMQIGPGTEIGDPTGAMLVGGPPILSPLISGPVLSGGMCYFVPRGERRTQLALLYYFTALTSIEVDPREGYESVVCFRDSTDLDAQSRWLRSGS